MQVVIRTKTGQLVRGELVTELPKLKRYQIEHIYSHAMHWNNTPGERADFKSLAHLLLWWDQLNSDIPAIEWYLLDLGIEALPGTYAGPGPWHENYNPARPLDSGVDWRRR